MVFLVYIDSRVRRSVILFFWLQVLGANVEKISAVTAEAFAALYSQFLPKVYRYVSYRIYDKHMAEDLTSAVF